VIDSFGNLRDRSYEREISVDDVCIICGLQRDDLETAIPFDYHRRRHKEDKYLHLLIYLRFSMDSDSTTAPDDAIIFGFRDTRRILMLQNLLNDTNFVFIPSYGTQPTFLRSRTCYKISEERILQLEKEEENQRMQPAAKKLLKLEQASTHEFFMSGTNIYNKIRRKRRKSKKYVKKFQPIRVGKNTINIKNSNSQPFRVGNKTIRFVIKQDRK